MTQKELEERLKETDKLLSEQVNEFKRIHCQQEWVFNSIETWTDKIKVLFLRH